MFTWITVISYHNHFVPAISYHSENPVRTITISYHCHFVPYADRYIITISYHMQIDTLYDHIVPYAVRYNRWPFRPYFTSYSNKCYTQVHAACWYRKKYVFKTGKKTNKKNIHVYYVIVYYHIFWALTIYCWWVCANKVFVFVYTYY